ncbi:MAG: alpha/beta hydrolase [Parachlamydia sp.]|nr:alpha/beta hydrolase [Parachlamydia sp.]
MLRPTRFGLSRCVDFEKNPYTLSDLAKDAIGLLDALHLKKAHLFGLSMGGPIAEIMAVHYPDRIASIAIMASHFDYRSFNLALAGLPMEQGLLSTPRESYLQSVDAIKKMPSTTEEEQVEQKYQAWQLLNGSVFPLEEQSTKQMLSQFIRRTRHPENLLNYRKAIGLSEELVKAIHSQVTVPTVIFYGSEDPIMGSDHAEAMAKAIAHSKYFYLEGMGHLPNPHFYEFLITEVVQNLDY